jgi:hypothetical protein
LGFDLPATLDKLTGVTFDPRLLWQRLRGSGGEVEPVTTRDDARLAASLAAVAETVDRPWSRAPSRSRQKAPGSSRRSRDAHSTRRRPPIWLLTGGSKASRSSS